MSEQDFENMSDEEFLALSQEDITGVSGEPTPLDPNEIEERENAEQAQEPAPVETPDPDPTPSAEATPETPAEGDPEQPAPEDKQEPESGTPDPMSTEGGAIVGTEDEPKEPEAGQEPAKEKEKAEPAKEDGADPKADDSKEPVQVVLPEGITAESVNEALNFQKLIMAPFKADGKDISVRSAEDAIRLMQQGANYSRRMQELKPLKAMSRMLEDNGLNDQNKLNFLIDLSKGDKSAITKLLKDHKVDPMDLDTTSEVSYQGNNYAGSTKDNDFREALETTLQQPEGKALLNDVQATWDDASKNQLREDPSILGNMIDMRQSGVYGKIVAEIEYQKSIGYLSGVPFLQAYDQVGLAMKNAGAFDQPQPAPTTDPVLAPLQVQPVASGARKAPLTKKAAPNPHLSSTPPSVQSGDAQPKPVNYDTLSDDDFLKMAPPS